jgi:predicted ATPase
MRLGRKMSNIKIKHFGAIKEGYQENDGFIDIKDVTVFIGNQGSGKSSIAKLISVFSWIEKTLTRGDYKAEDFTKYDRFKKVYCKYHRIENYFKDDTEITYYGKSFKIAYSNKKLDIIQSDKKDYLLPQIMYVPAERNFISIAKNIKQLKFMPESLLEFLSEFDNAKAAIKGSLILPINNVSVDYDRLNDILNIRGLDYKIRLSDSSSGLQSVVPLYLVSWFLAHSVKETTAEMSSEERERFKRNVEIISSDDSLSDEQKKLALSALSSKFNNAVFINIVEEPEQNLFPNAQQSILNSLLEFNATKKGNKLIMTTHSPYIISYLTLAIKAKFVFDKIQTALNREELENKLYAIVPKSAMLLADDLVIYELNDDGSIIKLEDYDGLPSDENYLNTELAKTNDLFTEMLEIEDLCQ